jgi:hypothetical protein
MLVFHGRDDASALSIIADGLDQRAWRTAAGGAGPDPKGFSVTERLEDAREWASWRALARLGDAARGTVLVADSTDLPLASGQPGQWADPGEWFIRPKDFVKVGPRKFSQAP